MPGTILVIGGAGYVGSHACKALAAAGYLPDRAKNELGWELRRAALDLQIADAWKWRLKTVKVGETVS